MSKLRRLSLSAIGTVGRDYRDVEWPFVRDVDFAYLGWLRRGNIGDESMYSAVRTAIDPKLTVRPVPLTSFGRVLAKNTNVDLLVIGGGTLLGRPEWTARISAAVSTLRPNRIVSFGTGVLPLQSQTGESTMNSDESRQLSLLLETFDQITVRGPRSVESLHSIGIESQAIGDPALLHSLSAPSALQRRCDTRILVNFANTIDRVRDGSAQAVRSAVLDACLLLKKNGYSVEFFAMERADYNLMRQFSASADVVHPYTSNQAKVLNLIRDSALVISERLHGSILAASQMTPFLAIPYKEKVYDFAESIKAMDSVLSLEHATDASALFCAAVASIDPYSSRQNNENVSAVARRAKHSLDTLSGGR